MVYRISAGVAWLRLGVLLGLGHGALGGLVGGIAGGRRRCRRTQVQGTLCGSAARLVLARCAVCCRCGDAGVEQGRAQPWGAFVHLSGTSACRGCSTRAPLAFLLAWGGAVRTWLHTLMTATLLSRACLRAQQEMGWVGRWQCCLHQHDMHTMFGQLTHSHGALTNGGALPHHLYADLSSLLFTKNDSTAGLDSLHHTSTLGTSH